MTISINDLIVSALRVKFIITTLIQIVLLSPVPSILLFSILSLLSEQDNEHQTSIHKIKPENVDLFLFDMDILVGK